MKYPILAVLLFVINLGFSQIFVHADATGSNDGTSWENAYTDLHTALVNAPSRSEIWIAAGEYKPTIINQPADSNYFYLDNDLTLIGGFFGNETSINQRDLESNKTILTGDINGDDLEDDPWANRGDNTNHVLYIDSKGVFLDGLHIQSGSARTTSAPFGVPLNAWQGGGIFATESFWMRNCIISRNIGLHGGGLYYSGEDEIYIFNSHFIDNAASTWGGAIIAANCSMIFQSCDFISNEAGDIGGGIFHYTNSSITPGVPSDLTFIGCDFIGNTARTGGGICNNHFFGPSICTIADCNFSENEATSGGGARFYVGGGFVSLSIHNSEFSDNICHFAGGGLDLLCREDTLITHISSCNFKFNRLVDSTLSYGGGLHYFGNGSNAYHKYLIKESVFEGNFGGLGGGFYDQKILNPQAISMGTISNCQFLNNGSIGLGGGLGKQGGNIDVVSCDFNGNFSEKNQGGGFTYFGPDSVQVQNSVFHNNFSEDEGSAVTLIGQQYGLIENSLVYENAGNYAVQTRGHLILRNSSIVNNDRGLLMNGTSPKLILQNSIFNNTSDNFFPDSIYEITSMGGNISSDNSLYSYIDGYAGFNDYHNTDPELDDDFRPLDNSSICVDKGNPEGIDPFSLDLDGNPRIRGGQIDIGPYESDFVSSVLNSPRHRHIPFRIISNPVQYGLQIKIYDQLPGDLNIDLLNAAGQIIQSSWRSPAIDNEIITVPVNDLAVGAYFVRLRSEGQFGVKQFQKY